MKKILILLATISSTAMATTKFQVICKREYGNKSALTQINQEIENFGSSITHVSAPSIARQKTNDYTWHEKICVTVTLTDEK